jgi:hypothetical protein
MSSAAAEPTGSAFSRFRQKVAEAAAKAQQRISDLAPAPKQTAAHTPVKLGGANEQSR